MLRVLDLPDPVPAEGQVLVRVKAAGVQPYDCAVRAGWLPAGVPPTFPRIPGNEFAGVIEAGPGAGTEVLGFGQLGAYAELLAVPADQAVPKPAGMPWAVAGGFSAGAQTAHIALDELAPTPCRPPGRAGRPVRPRRAANPRAPDLSPGGRRRHAPRGRDGPRAGEGRDYC